MTVRLYKHCSTRFALHCAPILCTTIRSTWIVDCHVRHHPRGTLQMYHRQAVVQVSPYISVKELNNWAPPPTLLGYFPSLFLPKRWSEVDGLSSFRKAASIAWLKEFWKLGTGTRSELSLSPSLSPGAGGARVEFSSEIKAAVFKSLGSLNRPLS